MSGADGGNVPLFGANKPTGVTPVGPSAGQKLGRGALSGSLSSLGQPQQMPGAAPFVPGPATTPVDASYFAPGQQNPWQSGQRSIYG